LTQEGLADQMGVPVEIVEELESATHNKYLSSNNTLMLLALALKLPRDALFKYTNDKSESATIKSGE
jgi:hypothetical protein